MTTASTKFTVGLFVLTGITLSVIIIIALGMTKILNRGKIYVTFFDESVQGLGIDSPVKYRGVPIGRVSKIKVAPDSHLIEVIMEMEKDAVIPPDSKAQLSSVGITGSMFVNLDLHPFNEPNLSPKITFTSEYPVIPSVPSNIVRIMNNLSDLYQKIQELDIKGISQRITESLDHFTTSLDDMALAELSQDARTTLQSINRLAANPAWENALTAATDAGSAFTTTAKELTVASNRAHKVLDRVDHILLTNESTVNATLHELHHAAVQTTALMNEGSSMIAGSRNNINTMQKHLLITLQNLQETSRTLNQLLDEVKDQPSRLLLGDPPKPRNIQAAQ